MAIFPTLSPSSRTFTPGRHPHSEISTLNGLQVRVLTSNVILEQRLRLTFVALTEAQMLSIRSHYNTQQGRFLSFPIPDSLLRGMNTPADFTPTGYSWIYGSPPQVEDIPGTQRYTVSVELTTVPGEGANINGAEFSVSISLSAGVGSVATISPGFDLSVSASVVGGVVADNTSAGLDVTIPASLASGAATGGVSQNDPYFSNVILLLHADGANGGTTFIDSSSYNQTVTRSGTGTTSTALAKYGTASYNSPGNEASLDVAASTTIWDLAANDFTMETWIYLTSYPTGGALAAQGIIVRGNNAGNNFSFNWTFSCGDGTPSSTAMSFEYGTSVNTRNYYSVNRTTPVIALNTWHHMAVSRNGTSLRFFQNGVQFGATQTVTTTPIYNLSVAARVGRDYYTNTAPFGYMDDVRVTKGVGRYTANFTPPTAAFPDVGPVATDPYFSNVLLLLHGDGANNGTTFTDSSSYARTVTSADWIGGAATAVTSTAAQKYGTGSILIDGQQNYLSVPYSADWDFGAGDFTVEAWIYMTAWISSNPGETHGIMCRGQNALSAPSFSFAIQPGDGSSSQRGLYFLLGTSSSTSTTYQSLENGSYALNTWHHVAACRSGSNLRLFANGTQVGATHNVSTTAMYHSGTQVMQIGRRVDSFYNSLLGYIDDARITKGVARYTANFTPPTAAFPDTDGLLQESNTFTTLGTSSSLFNRYGYEFTVGASPLTVSKLGVVAGNTTERVIIHRTSDSAVIVSADISSNATVVTADITPVTLAANTQYTISYQTPAATARAVYKDITGNTISSRITINRYVFNSSGTGRPTETYGGTGTTAARFLFTV